MVCVCMCLHHLIQGAECHLVAVQVGDVHSKAYQSIAQGDSQVYVQVIATALKHRVPEA